MVVAGILHDTLEDTAVKEEDILTKFGEWVLNLVKGASEPDKSLSWKERKTHTIEHLASADRDLQLIALCDKFANLSDMEVDLILEVSEFWQRINVGVENQKWYYESLVEALKDVELYNDFCETVGRVFVN